MRRPGVVAVALGILLVRHAGDALAWTARIAGVRSLDDHVADVASDPAGDLIVVGDGAVAKHARAGGARLWRTKVIGAGDTVNFLTRVVVDAAGDVVVVGIVADSGREPDAAAWKLSGSDGRVLWRFRFDGPGHSSDYATGVAIDPHGDVIVGGTSYLIAEDMLALKIDGDTGVEKWHSVVPGPTAGQDQGLAVAVDANGDVAVVGDSTSAGVDRFATIKLRGTDGTLLWRAFAAAPEENGQADDAAFDAAGDLVVVGAIAFDATGFDVAVVKYNGATGAERWHRYADGSAHDFDFGEALDVDPQGNIVAVGSVVNGGTGTDLLVLRLRPDGSEVWRRDIDGGTGAYDDALDVAIVGDRVVVAAATDGQSFDETRFAAIGLDAATGDEAWRRTRQGDAGGRDRATRVVAGRGGSAFVVGELANNGTRNDVLMLDADAATGAGRWELTLNATTPDDDAAEAVAVDARGDAIASGTVGTARTAKDFTVVRLAGRTGAVAWRTSIDGVMHLDDAGGPVVVDDAGDVLAAGTTVDGPGLPPTDPRFPGLPPLTNVTVVKLDGASGAERWRSAPFFGGRGLDSRPTGLALAGPDLVVAGWFGTSDLECRSAVVKLRGDDGAELWRRSYFNGFQPTDTVAAKVDRAGDVVVASQSFIDKLRGADGTSVWGMRPLDLPPQDLALDAQGDAYVVGGGFAITKIRGSDGVVVWAVPPGAGSAHAVQVDGRGDVVVAGAMGLGTDERLAVVKVDGATGAILWTRVASGRGPGRGLTLAIDGAGDVTVGGAASVSRRGEDLAVLKLRGSDGHVRWQRLIDGGGRGNDRAQALALDRAGNAIAAGILRGAASGEDFAVVRFDGRTGRFADAPPGPLRRNEGPFSGDRGTTSTK